MKFFKILLIILLAGCYPPGKTTIGLRFVEPPQLEEIQTDRVIEYYVEDLE